MLDRINAEVTTIERAMQEGEAQDRLEQHRALAEAHKTLKRQRSDLPQQRKDEADDVAEQA